MTRTNSAGLTGPGPSVGLARAMDRVSVRELLFAAFTGAEVDAHPRAISAGRVEQPGVFERLLAGRECELRVHPAPMYNGPRHGCTC